MILRRGVNVFIILIFLLLLILNLNVIFGEAEENSYIYAGVILLVPLFFLFREIRLWYYRDRIILLHINHSVIILMIILAVLSYYLYSIFDISSIPAFSAFYLISTMLFPVIGLISADQYIFVRKKHLVFNIDKRLKVRKTTFESVKVEHRQIVVNYSSKSKALRLGRHEDQYRNLVQDITKMIEKYSG